GLDLEEEGIKSEEELIFWLRDHVDEYNYTRQDVHDMVIKSMQAEYLSGYTNELLKLSDNENLSRALKEVDYSEAGTLQELYEHLVSDADTYGYTTDDVNRMFALLSQKEELHELHSQLTEIATGDLLKVLSELDTEDEGIDTPVELITYLIDEAENNEYTEEDAMILLLDYLEKEDLRERIKLLIGTSSGEMQNLLLNLDTGQNNIRNLDDLYNHLMQQASFYDYNEEDVIRLFLNLLKIVEHEPIVEEIMPPRVAQEKEKGGKGWIFIVFGGLALIILIFLFVRRKKPDKEDETV
ncbi:MAG: LPXTG cell wall anchor domain-containing protein, partial [Bacteroidales bacterium]|nr:LPXTG cell wall anchor domain-containing protein [Bacteroidales bacterium]